MHTPVQHPHPTSILARLLGAAVLLGLAAPTAVFADAAPWKIDAAHTRVGFSVPHMVISDVEGRFHGVSGDIRIDDSKPGASSVRLEIEAASVDTDNDKRDEHLRSPDFFDAKKHPKLTFVSTGIKKAGKAYKVTGDLSIRGVTRRVTLRVELSKALKNPWGQTVRAARVTGKLNRKDFGLTWNKALEAGGVLVGEEITLDIRMELNR